MKAIAVFPTAREVKIIDQEEPRIVHPTGVKLRMLEVGTCGTDKEICSFTYGAPRMARTTSSLGMSHWAK